MLASLVAQSCAPAELIVVDASAGSDTREVVEKWRAKLPLATFYLRADVLGAAAQRNQALARVSQPFVLFLDDDITFENECLGRLWRAMWSDRRLGGVNAMIINQRYVLPGRASRAMFRFLSGERLESYAGKVLGPAVNLLPEDRDDLPEIVGTEWLNTTCTLYRREALPDPPFDSHFSGYSMMEDLTLSIRVGRQWKLANARTARIFHDSVMSGDKRRPFLMSKMELVNRHYVMRLVLGRCQVIDYVKLLVYEIFSILSLARSISGIFRMPHVLAGKGAAAVAIVVTEWRIARQGCGGSASEAK